MLLAEEGGDWAICVLNCHAVQTGAGSASRHDTVEVAGDVAGAGVRFDALFD